MKKATSTPRELGLAALIAATFLILYLYTNCGVCSGAPDSIDYLLVIDSANPFRHPLFFHPHHLLYNTTARVWLKLCTLLGGSGDPGSLISILNSIFGALTLSTFYLTLRKRLELQPLSACAHTALPGLSFGFWFYSVCLEVYLPPLFFLLLSFYLLTAESTGPKNLFPAGLAQAAATLFHQVHILFLLPAATAILLRSKRQQSPAGKSLLFYLAGFLPALIIPYCLVMFTVLQPRSPAAIWHWLTKYRRYQSFGNILAPSSLLKALLGFGRSIVGGNFLFAIPAVRRLLNRLGSGHSLADELFLVRRLPETSAWILSLLALLLLIIIAYLFFSALKQRSRLTEAQTATLVPATTWFAAYSLFFLAWVPENVEFWIAQALCMWLILACLSNGKGRIPPPRLPGCARIGAIILLFSLNYWGAIKFLQDNSNDYYYRQALALAPRIKRGDLVILGPGALEGPASDSWSAWMLQRYLLRHTPATVWDLTSLAAYLEREKAPREKSSARIQKTVETILRQGHNIYIYQDVIDSAKGEAAQSSYAKVMAELKARYRHKWRLFQAAGQGIYLLSAQTANNEE